MVKLIKTMLWPIIKKCKAIFLAMILVSALGITMGVGFISSYYNFTESAERYFSNYGLPDVTLDIDNTATKEELTDALKDLPYTFAYRVNYNLNAMINDRTVTLNINTITDDSFAKLYSYEEAEEKPDYLNICVHKAFAEINHLSAGDFIWLGFKGDPNMHKSNISKIVLSPEAIHYTFNYYIDVDKFDFGYIYASPEELNKMLPDFYKDKVNQIIVKGNENNEVIKANVSKALEKSGFDVLYSFTRENSSTQTYIDYVFEEIGTISITIPIIFIAITFALVFLFLLLIINNFLREIGIMHALGIKKKKILGLITAFSLSIGIIASLIGVGVSYLLTNFISSRCGATYLIPAVENLSSPIVAVNISLILIALSVLASLITMVIIHRISPKDAIMNNASNFKPLPKKINHAIERGSINTKININNIHKNFVRFLVSVFAFACSYAIIFSGISFYNGTEYLINQMHIRSNYQGEIYSLDFYKYDESEKREKFQNQIAKLDGIIDTTPMLLSNVNLSFKDREQSISLCGVKSERSIVTITDFNNNDCPVLPNSIVLDQWIANEFDIHVNDEVLVNGTPLIVNQISNLCSKKHQYVEYSTFLNKIKPAVIVDIMAVKTNNINNVTQQIRDLAMNTYNVVIDKYYDSALGGYRLTQTATIMVIGFVLAIGFLVIFIMNYACLTSQKRKFSILCALGVKRKKITNLVLQQILINFIIGIAIGVPCGMALGKLFAKISSNKTSSHVFVNYWWIYLVSFLTIALYLLFNYLQTYFNIKKWNINDNIKSRE